jgi:acyl-coenzyme A synthetase/AMP-(fatty) acid ligase
MSLWCALGDKGHVTDRLLNGATASIALADLILGSALGGRTDELRGRSVLIWTKDQFDTALSIIELDGVARRLVLCPSDFPVEHLPFVIDSADVDAIVSDQATPGPGFSSVNCFVTCGSRIGHADCHPATPSQTEWILLTSGTTGLPKLVAHTLTSLAGAIHTDRLSSTPVVWSTFYDIRRYGGLQIFLRAILTGASLVLAGAQESTSDFLGRAGANGVTHISGTPSHWRRALMSPSARLIDPQYVRLSGEAVDQAILNQLQAFYPKARVSHAFASTEAGVAFDVTDGLAGFPASFFDHTPGVEMKVEDDSLRIRSTRNASRYLGNEAKSFTDSEGFVDTGDILELRGDRYYFVGRRDGVINVGGLKVHPEEVEAVINHHPRVRVSLVRTRKNPITGALVVADIVLKETTDSVNGGRELQQDILMLCRNSLASHKVPAVINFVPSLAVAETGKMLRR